MGKLLVSNYGCNDYRWCMRILAV